MMMMLPMNSCSSLKYRPFEYASPVKPFGPSLTQNNGLLDGSQSNKSSIRCSFRNSIYSTNKIGEDLNNRNHKTLEKSTVPCALGSDFESKSRDEITYSTSFVDVLKKKLGAFYHLSRPFVCISYIVGVASISLLPVQSIADLTPTFFLEVIQSGVPIILMTIFVATINELLDIEIDKINKPYLPLASGDFSMGEGIAIAIISTLTSLAIGVMLRSPPLVIGLILRWIVGFAYSVDLPFLRWKGSPVMAAFTMVTLNGLLLHFPSFIHAQKYLLGRPVVFTKSLLFAAAIMVIFNIAIAFLKDVPDVEGDEKFGYQTLPVILGKEKVFSIAVKMLLMAYGGAVLAGACLPSLPFKLVTMIAHSALGFILWQRSRTVNLSDNKSSYLFFIFIWQAIVLYRIFLNTLCSLRRNRNFEAVQHQNDLLM